MLEELIGNLPLQDLSGWTAFLIVMFMLATGRLVPRKTHEEVRVDRDEYRKNFERQQEVNFELSSAVKAVIPFVESADHALRSIQAMGAAAFAAAEEKTNP